MNKATCLLVYNEQEHTAYLTLDKNWSERNASKALDIYERHSKMRERLLENMMATRKAKSRLKDNNTHSVYDLIKESIDRDFVVEEIPDEFKND